MDRAYSVITLKSFDEESRTFTGIATTPTPDRMQDVVEPTGAQFKLPLPLLWQHDSAQPIGHVTAAKVGKDGITVTAKLVKIVEAGKLKDRLDEAWQSMKSGLVRGLSIGFRGIETQDIKDTKWGIRFVKWDWLELSAVTIPANADCSITAIKSIDQALLAASGHKPGEAGRPPPGVSGTKQAASSGGFFHSRSKGTQVKTLQEMREERNTKSARMAELVELFKTDGHEASEEETSEFDTLEREVKGLDQDIRIAGFHAMQGAAAKAVDGSSQKAGSASRGGIGFVKKTDPEDSFKGQAFTRYLVAKAAAFVAMKSGQFVSPADIAQHRWGKTHPNLVNYIKAAVAGGGTGSGEWGAELAQSDTRFTGDFIEYLYSKTVFDALPLRPIPARVHIKGQDGAATGYWVGESKAINVSKADFSDVELTPLKVGAMAVCSKELVADSSPSAEMWIRDSIAKASAQRVDTTFLSADPASSGVSPAGILNGVSALAPSGADAAAIRADFQSLVYPFITAKNAGGLVQVMNPSLAMAMSMLVNALGQTEFPDITETGGTLFKRPVYTGDNVAGGDWIVLKPDDIWKIGDGGVDVSMSDTATIEQDSAPQGASDTPTAASATLMSMWQTESVAFKVVRRINYAKRRTGAVTLLSNAEYGGVVS